MKLAFINDITFHFSLKNDYKKLLLFQQPQAFYSLQKYFRVHGNRDVFSLSEVRTLTRADSGIYIKVVNIVN